MKNLRNTATLIGHIGNAPEFKELENGTMAKFSLATNDSYKNKNGEKVESTDWHNIIVWGKQAIYVRDYLKKGSHIMVEGKITTNVWEDKDGKKNYSTQIDANDFLMLDSKK